MKRVLAMSFCAAALALGGEWSGHLLDANCKAKAKDVASHPTKCAIGCAGGGYGIVTADGNFVKFDKAGDEKALAALKATKKDKDLTVKVTGTKEGDTLKVDTLTLD